MPEIFNQKRMERCVRIHQAIWDNWQRTKRLDYTVRATEPVNGLTLCELRTKYFAVGVGNDLTDLPLADVLVIFSAMEQQYAAFNSFKGKLPKEFKVRLELTSDFSEDEAARLLSQIQIETPFDKGKRLRIVAEPQPPADRDDDPQTPK